VKEEQKLKTKQAVLVRDETGDLSAFLFPFSLHMSVREADVIFI
jgi:hypothetical protein